MKQEYISFYNNKCFLLVARCEYNKKTNSAELINPSKV